MKPRGARTWGLDDPGLVGLGRVAVTLSVGEALHHLAAAAAAARQNPREAGCRREGLGKEGREEEERRGLAAAAIEV
jgi:hypothetical protein